MEEEKEVNRVVRAQWPGMSGKAKRRSVRRITEEHELRGDDIVVDTHFEGTRQEVRRVKGGGKRRSRWVTVEVGGEKVELYCDTGSNITIITPDIY